MAKKEKAFLLILLIALFSAVLLIPVEPKPEPIIEEIEIPLINFKIINQSVPHTGIPTIGITPWCWQWEWEDEDVSDLFGEDAKLWEKQRQYCLI